MAWVKLDDQFPLNTKTRALTVEARYLYVTSLCWCAMQMNDGTFPASDVPTVAMLAGVPPAAAGQLSPKLWHPEGTECASCRAAGQTTPVPDGHVAVHEYLAFNPSRAQIMKEREITRRRKAMNVDPELRKTLRARDGDFCRYCAKHVNWRDRKGPGGGTYDHVLPMSFGGDESVNNIVVCCRECNTRKGARTPDQAGMVLLPPPDLSKSRSDLGPNLDIPSRPVPRGNPVSRRLVTHDANGTRPDDDDLSTEIPDDVWTHYAELKLGQQHNIRNPGPWKQRTATNARTELAGQAGRWWHDYELTPYRLAQALVAGTVPAHTPRRNGTTPT